MDTIVTKEEIITREIQVKTQEGEETIKAIIVGEIFGIHQTLEIGEQSEDPVFSITHIPTGYALLHGLYKPSYGYIILKRLLATLTPEQLKEFSFTDPKKAPKQLGKKIAKYIQAAKRCENNRETEKLVGVFYKDRERAERLRMKINPEANTLLDNNALGSERLTASLIFGEMKLS